MRTGIDPDLEELADEILRVNEDRVPHFRADHLPDHKYQARRSREVYVRTGTPDAALRRGLFIRALNTTSPHLNSRDGARPPSRINQRTSSDTRVE